MSKVKCCNINCSEEGLYPAPKMRPVPPSCKIGNPIPDDKPREHNWYCLEHIREFNAGWDFFDGMSEREIDEFRYDAITGHRRTTKIGPKPTRWDNDRINQAYDAAWRFSMGYEYINEPKEDALTNQPKSEMEAMKVLGVSYPLSKKELKKRYHDLVKRFHPDQNNGGKTGEEKLKVINQAYTILNSNL